MNTSRRRVIQEINITPLTDIFLVLLIIMIVVTPTLQQQGLDLAITQVTTEQPTDTKQKTFELAISAGGEYRLANKPVARDGLIAALREATTQFPDGVVIRPDPESLNDALAYAVGAVQSAGITKVGIQRPATEAAASAAKSDANAAPAASSHAKKRKH